MFFSNLINKVRFIVLRIKVASFSEILHKLKEIFFVQLSLQRVIRDNYSQTDISITGITLPTFQLSPLADTERHFYPAPCEQGLADVEAWQRGHPFLDLNGANGLDIRLAWEAARLQDLAATMLQAHGEGDKTGQRRALACAKDNLLGWLKNNPFPKGPHYLSAMECGLRIPVFFYALKLLAPLANEEKQQLLQAIWQHGWWIAHRLSLYSSLGNHTVCESLGLVFAGAIFLPTEQGKQWLRTGIRLLEQELTHQVLPDGGPIEQAIKYHRFVLDAYWLALTFLTHNGLYDCSGWRERLRLGEQFLQAFSVGPDTLLPIGDSDDGHIIAPGLSPVRESPPPPTWSVKTFPATGYTVIRGRQGWLLTFDHGPLGMPPFYAHGHADALAVTLSVNGRTILVDPGTYRYNGVPEWRRYFKGTRAHNTVTVDGLDQAVQETSFIWSHPYRATLINTQETAQGIFLAAQHDGYTRLAAPVYHQRRLFVSPDNYLLIHDTFRGQGTHTFELNYHFHPEAVVQPCQQGWEVSLGEVKVFLRLWAATHFRLFCGQEQPLLGWYSATYGQKVPCPVLSAHQLGKPGEVSFVTGIYLLSPGN